MTPERIAELRAIEKAATPGPWVFKSLHPDGSGLSPVPYAHPMGDEIDKGDGDFLAAARTGLLEALDAIERVRKACETGSYTDHEWSPSGVRVVMVSEVIAALEGVA